MGPVDALVAYPRLGAALIAAAAAVLGALLAGAFALGREALLDRARRRRRVVDLEIAILAEIRAYTSALQYDDLDAQAARITAAIREADEDEPWVPFIPRERNATVFTALIADVQILPRAVVEPVVLYYQQLAALEAMIEDMRDPRFAALDANRRALMYGDYVAMKKEALARGTDAAQELARHIRPRMQDAR